MDLFADDAAPAAQSRGSSPESFQINEEYARRFQHNKERTELHQLQERYGKSADGGVAAGESDDDSSSSDETEDDDGEQVTADVDAAILRTLAKIRGRDESIYDVSKRVFDDERALASKLPTLPSSSRSATGKRVTLADYQRKRIQDLIKTSDDPARALAEATTAVSRGPMEDESALPLAPAAEAEALRKEVTAAFHASDDDDDDDGFFTRRQNGAEGEEDDPAAYKRFLLGALGEDNERRVREILRAQIDEAGEGDDADGESKLSLTSKAKEERRERKRQAKLAKAEAQDAGAKATEQANEDFLMDYILNRGWLDKGAAPSRKPARPGKAGPAASKAVSKDEAMSVDEASDHEEGRDWEAEAAELSSEASFDSRAEAYETAYNFRFEALEAGDAGTQIQSFARNPVGTARRVDDKRKREREERKARKEAEKRKKLADLDRLADLKRRDIVDRLKKLKEMTGSENIELGGLDLDGDFDPEAHDRAMQGAFNDSYYNEVDPALRGMSDDDAYPEKPIWDDDIDIDDILADEAARNAQAGPSSKDRKAKAKPAALAEDEEDGPISMDADFLDGEQESGAASGTLSKKERKKLKKKLKAAEKKLAKPAAQGEAGVEADDMDAELVAAQPSDPAERKRKVQQAVEEYYNLDYEDVVGDVATRFKYAPVEKETYGLTPVEILLADDAELNEVVGLKHIQPYRRGAKKPADHGRRLAEFRRNFARRHGDELANTVKDGAASVPPPPKKPRLGKKEREKRKAAAAAAAAATTPGEAPSQAAAPSKDAAAAPAAAGDSDEARAARKREKKERKRLAAEKTEA